MGDVPEKALVEFLSWAVSYEAKLPDVDGEGTLAGELRAYVIKLACESFPAVEAPFDLRKAAAGALPPDTPVSLPTLLGAVRHHLYVTKDPAQAFLAGEMAWKFLQESLKVNQPFGPR